MTDTDNTYVRVTRAKLGLSQKKFAALLGVGTRSLMRYEKPGYAVPQRAMLLVKRVREEYEREHRR